MPINKYALLRYRIIDRCISNKYKPFPDKETLRQACEDALYGSGGERISASTIEKDIFAMRNEENLGYFAPIAYSKLDKGYYYEDPDYSLEQMPLNDVDIEAIRFAANTLSQFRSIDLFKSSEAAIDKILDRLSLSPHTGEKSVEQYVQFETAPVYKGGAHLPILFKAIRERVPVKFYYEKFTGGKQRQYILHPYLLKEYRNRWYVIGYNPDKKGVVVFGLDRVAESIQIVDAPFVRDADFDPEIYFTHSIGITAVEDAPEKVHLRFSPLTGKYVESQPLHHSQKILRNDEVALEVELFLCITKELVMQILSYGADVEVKKPEKLRTQIKNSLAASLKFYAS